MKDFRQVHGKLFDNQKAKILDIKDKARALRRIMLHHNIDDATSVHEDVVDKECLLQADIHLAEAIKLAVKAYSNINTNNVTIPNENETNDQEVLHEE